ncbi:MAG TPA: DegT/DnrJ/EryC1/StrS family aminotransferase [Actinomycetota bacterium]|nr:DegT/DnrJ/EryC1/StrS family aminotransferase [Actinomycetota bacterium]
MNGGTPAFPDGLAFLYPRLPDTEALVEALRGILESRQLTNGRVVREFESRAAEYLGVSHCVAVSSCTAGLMLVLRAANLSGDVILPSFTFTATAHAVAWNALRPVFADVDPDTLTLSPTAAARAAGVRASAILATHTFGTPCDVDALGEIAVRNGLRLVYDAAHAFGSRHGSTPIGGFGDAEVFSLSPTKVLVAGEGGLIATNDKLLAERCRIGRDYANPGDYDCQFYGLNARMSEIHAAVALASLDGLDDRLARRSELAERYWMGLERVPGISWPVLRKGDRSTYKDFTILVDPDAFGMSAASLAAALRAEGVQTRRYYAPPVHAQRAYRDVPTTNGHLAVTERVAERVLTLPLWIDMSEEDVDLVVEAVRRIGEFASTHSVAQGDEVLIILDEESERP